MTPTANRLSADTDKRSEGRSPRTAEHPLRCRCGTLKGVLANPQHANRVVCYCRDCQAFAHFLGDAQQVLDARGGSDIIQVLPKNLTLTQGVESLACLRLTSKGLLRWYTSCCHTPIGNTLATPKLSFTGLVHSCLESNGIALDDAFGPVTAWVHTRGAKGNPKPKEAGRGKVGAWFIRTTLRARLNRDYKLTPFFHRETGAPVVTPQVLSGDLFSRLMDSVRAPSSG
jgi:hypothetical protein